MNIENLKQELKKNEEQKIQIENAWNQTVGKISLLKDLILSEAPKAIEETKEKVSILKQK